MDLQDIKVALEAISEEMYTGSDMQAKKMLAQLQKDVTTAISEERAKYANQPLHASIPFGEYPATDAPQ